MQESKLLLIETRLESILGKVRGIQEQLENHDLQNKQILDFREACRFLGISGSKLYKMTSGGSIPYCKPSGKLYFKREDLENHCLQKPAKSAGELALEAREWLNNNLKTA